MRKVHKFWLDRRKRSQGVELPSNCKIVDVEVQEGDIFLWAEFSTSSRVMRWFQWFHTGADIPEGAAHVKTLHFPAAHCVEHLYEISSPPEGLTPVNG